jgi:biopolymer transport protein ExbD
MIDINTTPLIDVMLVLLVMLIITIPIQLHSVNLNMPTGNPPPPLVEARSPEDRHRQRGDDLLEQRDRAGPDRARRTAQGCAEQAVQPELHLRPDKAAKYDVVAAVMASAQRLGLTKIGLRRQRAVHRGLARQERGQAIESNVNGLRPPAEIRPATRSGSCSSSWSMRSSSTRF